MFRQPWRKQRRERTPARFTRRRTFRPTFEALEDRNLLSNLVVAENLLPGTPPSTWDVPGAGDSTIQGFAADISVNQGQTISFKINDTAKVPYHIDIYRVGYYQGLGARLVTTIPSSQTLDVVQPNPKFDPKTALVDAGNWSVTASWAVPNTATSGVYFGRVTRDDTGGAFMIMFVVRNDSSHSQVLFQTSDSTWEAYNTWGGYSLYQYTGTTAGPGDAGAAYAVSYNRPLITRGTPGGLGDTNSFFYEEYPMVRFLEANGYDVSYFTDLDSDRNGALIQQHQIFLSVGHDEYWSGNQFNNVMAARDAGVSLAFFSGNEVFWKTYFSASIDGSNTPYRTLVDYKETHANAIIDPNNPNIWTGTWMDPRFSPPADGGRPQNQLTGTLFTVNRGPNDTGTSFTVPYSDSQMRFWRNTSVAALQPGQSATLGDFELGYEWDEDVDNGFRPAGLIDMSSTTESVTQKFTDYGNTTAPGTATHSLTLYRAASGALAFGAGMVQYDWGLDGNHDGPGGSLGLNSTPVLALQQATVNLFADMNVQPGTLQPGLVAASSSIDVIPPTSVITSPGNGATFFTGASVTISGTATDAGGGGVAGIEVSVDGGMTWHPASRTVTGGTTSWSYTWVPNTPGQITIKSRATDDSGNIEIPSSGVTVQVSFQATSTAGLVAAYTFNEGSGTTLTDSTSNHNNGTISNATWAPGRFGGSALSFNGVNSWVTINSSSSLNLTTGMTLEAWVNPASLADWSAILLKERTGGLAYALYADNGAGQPPSAYVDVSNTDNSAVGGSVLPLNSWSFLSGTYDGSNLDIYVNGTLTSTQSVSGNIVSSSNVLRMGGDSIWGEYFKGLIDEVRIYNRSLNQSEIRSDMTTPVGGTPETTSPSVTLTAPAAGATVSGVTTLSANATDSVYVAAVQFLVNGQAIGAAGTSAPYAFSWDTRALVNGTYQLSARAWNLVGNSTTSGVETVTVNNPPYTTPPTVTITYPPGGFLTNGKIVFNAVASDPVGIASVQYQLNGVNLGSALTTAPYRLLWDSSTVASGTYSLVAVATDAAGNQASSGSVSITVDHTAPTITSVSPAAGATGVSTASNLTATFSESVQIGSISLVLKDPSGNSIATTYTYDDTTHTATFTHGTEALEPLTAYTATVNATDLAGNSMATPFSWSFTTSTAIVGATIWAASSVPGVPLVNDSGAVELGVKFRSDVAGFITGVRFYKGGTANGGTHVGHLWTSTGTLLATATFTGETNTGWQQVNFATQVAISAGTTYVASYFAPTGEYAGDSGYFASSGVNSGPLHALANGVDGPDGVYVYGASGGFPNQTFASANYWVDVVFNSSTQDTTPPTVTSELPGVNATNVAQNSTVTTTFSEPVQSATISLVLVDSGGHSVAGAISYNAGTNTVTLTPSSVLAASTTYSATVSGATDLSGNVMTAPFTWSFTTANPSAPPTVTAETPTPGSSGVPKGTAITATFSKQVDPTTISFVLTDSSGNGIPGAVSYDNEANVATFTPNSALVASTTFTVTVSGAKDLFGNVMAAPVSWSFTTGSATSTITIWSSTTTPAVASANDPSAVNLGIKFEADIAGAVNGIRFYKGSGNTGTHIGYLWDSTGHMLASATFTNETASGWQQVNFTTPVTISANTVYIASYFAPSGGYAYTSAYFATSGVDVSPLHALSNAAAGGNDVYTYSSSGVFPTNSYNSTNYWVDVVFSLPNVTPTVPVAFQATGFPASSTAGTTQTITVTALNADGTTTTGYQGTVHFTSSDPAAVLPADYTFVPANGGVHTFSVTLKTAVAQSITVTDAGNSGITGSEGGIGVTPATPAKLVIQTQASTAATAGVAFTVQPVIYEEDAFGNIITSDSTHTVTAARDGVGSASLQGTTTVTLSGGVATFSSLSYNKAETMDIAFSTNAGSFTATSNNIVVSAAAASQLVITQQASGTATAGVAFTTQPIVAEEDAFGNIVTSDSIHTVTAARGSVGSASLQGTSTVTLSSGVATFSGLSYNKAEAMNIAFSTNAGGFTTTSNNIVVSPSAASQLIIAQQPSATATAGSPFAAQPVIYEEDAFGNLEVADNTTQITASLHSGTGPLQGTVAITVAGGVATFTNLSDSKAETIAIDFTSGSLTMATSVNIVISPATGQLVIAQQPSGTATAGVSFALQPVIYEEDAFGNIITSDSTSTVTATRGGVGSASLQGTTTVTLLGGVATFSGLSYNKAEAMNIVFSTNAGSFTTTSNNIVVSPAAASQLVITQQASATATAGVAFTTQPVVAEEDAFGNIITSDSTSTVTATRGGVGSASLQGTTTLTLSGGVATFSGLSYIKAEAMNIVFSTSAGSFTATSNNIAVSPAAASQLVITQQASATATAGIAFTTQPVVAEEDAFGNIITSDSTHTVTAARDGVGSASLQGTTTVTLSGGVATFSGLSYNKAETMDIAFSTNAGSFTATSNNIVVSPAAASQLVITQQASGTATAGVAFTTQPVVAEEDAFGNIVTSDSTHTVTATRGSVGSASLQGTTTVTLSGGVATFSGLSYNKAETMNIAFSTNAGSFTATSNNVLLSAAAASQLVITQQPSATATAGVAFTTQPVVAEEDAFGNIITGDSTHTVTAARGSAGSASLQGTTTLTLSGGVATFSGLSYNKAETMNIVFSTNAGSFTTTSNSILVSPATASTIMVAGFPSPTTAGVAGNVTVTAKDAFGNTATGYTGTVHLTSTDSQAVLPANYTYTSTDAGAHIFGVTLKTAGTQSITVADTVTATITGTQNGITVNPGSTSALVVSGFPTPDTAGVAHNVTVTAKDAFGNTTTGYRGTIQVTSSDGQASLPANYAFTSGDAGVHTFSLTLKTAGTQSIKATDTTTATITGTQSGITVNAAAATTLIVSGFPSPDTAGVAHNITVTAKDAFGNTATGYRGIVHFTTSDGQATLPANYTFKSGDAGVHTFSVTLKTAGTQSITATDTITGTIKGTQSGITVNAAAAASFRITAGNAVHGVPFDFTVTALDAFGNVATGYRGTVHFTSNGGNPFLPANYTFTAGDAGAHTFTMTWPIAGTWVLTVTDTTNGTIKGSQTVTVA
jgi:methionine-rich copper-binding protein CopC